VAFSGRHGSLSNINLVEPTAMQVPEVKAKLVTQGLHPVAVCADVGALLRKQSDEYGRLIREANIKAQ
jgi:hypothetical protein